MDAVDNLLNSLPAPITLVIGMVALLGGGHLLVHGAVTIARRLGVSTLLIGLTIVAFGTSAPELAFNIIAAVSGSGDLSFGNVVGSNIANIALVLGIASFAAPVVVHGRVIRKELPLLIGVSGLMLLLAWLPHSNLTIDGQAAAGYSRTDGLILLLGFMIMTWLWYRLGQLDRADPLISEAEEDSAGRPGSLPIAITVFLLGLILLVGGGQLAKNGAVGVASALGLSQSLIGLTIVAIATSLPELITSVVAARKGHADLAIGNVVGSNLFNILLVLGVTCLFGNVAVPSETGWFGISRGWWDLYVMMGLTVILLPISISNQRRIVKSEGAVLLACYAAYIAFSIYREMHAS